MPAALKCKHSSTCLMLLVLC